MAGFVSAKGVEPLETVVLTPGQMATVHMILSVLLDYPRENFGEALDATDDSTLTLPDEVRGDIDRFVDWARGTGQRGVEEHYVDMFDQRRRCALYLTYYAVGDTRQRGAAILGFREAMKAVGFEAARDELPDYLPVVLEMSAMSSDPVALELLASHREGIEVMRAALHGYDSPYAHLLNALCRTLPPVSDEVVERFQRLVTQGPPGEMVGVDDLPFPTISNTADDGRRA